MRRRWLRFARGDPKLWSHSRSSGAKMAWALRLGGGQYCTAAPSVLCMVPSNASASLRSLYCKDEEVDEPHVKPPGPPLWSPSVRSPSWGDSKHPPITKFQLPGPEMANFPRELGHSLTTSPSHHGSAGHPPLSVGCSPVSIEDPAGRGAISKPS